MCLASGDGCERERRLTLYFDGSAGASPSLLQITRGDGRARLLPSRKVACKTVPHPAEGFAEDIGAKHILRRNGLHPTRKGCISCGTPRMPRHDAFLRRLLEPWPPKVFNRVLGLTSWVRLGRLQVSGAGRSAVRFSALGSGPRGRRFKSARPDQYQGSLLLI